VPFCGMLLADLGADVLRIDRRESSGLGEQLEYRNDVLGRGKRSLAMDLKAPGSHERMLMLIEKADILIEGFRPGAMERLGLSPEVALSRNPRLVYGRMTGWGQDGPLACAAGHDINFLALTGALHAIGRAGEAPVPPLNLVADFGGDRCSLPLESCRLLSSARSQDWDRSSMLRSWMARALSRHLSVRSCLKAAGLTTEAPTRWMEVRLGTTPTAARTGSMSASVRWSQSFLPNWSIGWGLPRTGFQTT
jgi:hypothetical protein